MVLIRFVRQNAFIVETATHQKTPASENWVPAIQYLTRPKNEAAARRHHTYKNLPCRFARLVMKTRGV
jgi:hypothetical protein